jgi:hypothetical protein
MDFGRGLKSFNQIGVEREFSISCQSVYELTVYKQSMLPLMGLQ